jgi:uncharacterized phage protein (TIGR01671 family)
MREIKFRVWDNIEKAYLNEKDIAINNLNNIFIFEIYDKNDTDLWYMRLLPDPDNKRHVIEQYTGLKDKNGTEIYEGDVVETPEYPGKIVYNEKYACFELWRPRSSDCFIALTHQQDIGMGDLEVVGNIHENPELLEEK